MRTPRYCVPTCYVINYTSGNFKKNNYKHTQLIFLLSLRKITTHEGGMCVRAGDDGLMYVCMHTLLYKWHSYAFLDLM